MVYLVKGVEGCRGEGRGFVEGDILVVVGRIYVVFLILDSGVVGGVCFREVFGYVFFLESF